MVLNPGSSSDIIDEQFEDAVEHAEEGIRASLLPLDRIVNSQVKGIALISLGRVSDGVAILSEVRRECARNDWVYNLTGTDLILSISAVLQGRFAEGVKGIERYIALRDQDKYRVAADWGRIYLAEVYLELLAAKQRPSFRVLLHNSVFLIRTLPFAARRALNLLTHAAKNAQFSPEGSFTARINMDLGLLHQVKKRHGDARRHLEKAREFAAPRRAATMLAKIDAALADLP